MLQSVLRLLSFGPFHLFKKKLIFIIIIFCSAVATNFKDLMLEFQVYLHIMVGIF